jgi:two-component system nitrogen regulation response regulator GlnG
MQEVYKSIGLVASQDVTVMIRGESGTGKELAARAIYQFSERSDGPFLAVNCAAIPETLLESELFGHEKGAFTGADKRRIGKFEQCSGGTLFLDEIGDMPLLLQGKILRVLQDQSFERVGGNQTIKTDVRVLTATHRNLEDMVEKGQFREDLLYRLNGYTIALPSLIQRGEDLELLVDHFRRQANKDLDKEVKGVAPEAMGMLRQYGWPGNVRELLNVIRQAVLKTNGPVLLPDFLPEYIRRGAGELAQRSEQDDGSHPLAQLIERRLHSGSCHVYDEVVSVVEEQLIHGALDYTGGDKSAAIKRLGVNPASFRSTAALELLDLQRVEAAPATAPTETTASPTLADDLIKPGMTIEEIEKEAIKRALTHTNGCRTDAARMLGLSVRTLQRRIKEFDLDF